MTTQDISHGRRRRTVAASAAVLLMGVAVPLLLFGCTSSSSPDDADRTVGEFLQARLDGEGAEAYVAEGEIPLMYASTSGASYERYELVELVVPAWTSGRVFRVKLFTSDDETVVEQHLELAESGINAGENWWALGSQLVPGTSENGQPLGQLFDWLDFRLYDGNDHEGSPDNPEVPHEFKSTEWFLGGIFHYLTSKEVDALAGDLAGAQALLDDLESHVYWRAQGGEWVELPLVEDVTQNAVAPSGEVLPILQHTYHIFPAGSLAPGIYEWRWVLLCTDPFWADEECGDESVNGEVHIVP